MIDVMLTQANWMYLLLAAVLGSLGLWCGWRGLFGNLSKGRRRCPRCWYDLSSTPADVEVCSECGRRVKSERELMRARRRWWLTTFGLVLLIAAAPVWMWPGARREGWMWYVPSWALVRMYPRFDPPRVYNPRIPRPIHNEFMVRLIDGDFSLDTRRWLAIRALDSLRPDSPNAEYAEALGIVESAGADAASDLTPRLMELLGSPDSNIVARVVLTITVVGYERPEVPPLIRLWLYGSEDTDDTGWPGGVIKRLPGSGAESLALLPMYEELLESRPLLRGEVAWKLGLIGPPASRSLPALRSARAVDVLVFGFWDDIYDCAIEVISDDAQTMTEAYSRRLFHKDPIRRAQAAVMLYNLPRQFTPESLRNMSLALETELDYETMHQLLTAIANAPVECQSLLPLVRRIASDESQPATTRETALWVIDTAEHPR